MKMNMSVKKNKVGELNVFQLLFTKKYKQNDDSLEWEWRRKVGGFSQYDII